jgi:hypothetical protein
MAQTPGDDDGQVEAPAIVGHQIGASFFDESNEILEDFRFCFSRAHHAKFDGTVFVAHPQRSDSDNLVKRRGRQGRPLRFGWHRQRRIHDGFDIDDQK